MAGVQRYEGDVAAAPLPGVRVNGGAPVEALGGGAALAGFDAAGRTMDSFRKAALEERDQANLERTKAAYADLLKTKNDLFWGEDGVVSRRGLNAKEAPDVYLPKLKEAADLIEGGLANDDQKRMFRQMRMQEEGEFRSSVDRHVAQEYDRWQGENHKITTTALAQDAVKNHAVAPWKVGQNLALIADNARAEARRLGLGPDGEKALVAEWTTKVHAGVVESMLDNGDDMAAEAYFKKHRGELLPEVEGQLAKAVDVSSLRGQSQRLVDRIVAKYPSPDQMQSAREELAKAAGDNAKLRDAGDERLVREYGLRDRQRVADQESTFLDLWNKLEQTGSLDKADPGARIAGLDPKYQNSLMAFERRLKDDKPGKSDGKAWTRFMTMNAAELSKVTPAQLLTDAFPNMERSEYHQVVEKWRVAREAALGKPGKVEAFKAFQSDEQMVLNAMSDGGLAGVTPQDTHKTILDDSAKAEAYKKFSQDFSSRLQAYHAQTGKNADDEVKQRILDGMVSKQVFSRQKLWGVDALWRDSKTTLDKISPAEAESAYVPHDQIPDTIRGQLASISGRPLEKSDLEDAYGAALTKNIPRLAKILGLSVKDTIQKLEALKGR